MNQDKTNRCPGCGHHCPLTAPRCKFGRKYQERMNEENAAPCKKTKACKWEAYVMNDGLAWHLLMQAKKMKKALRDQQATEHQLFMPLSDQEQQMLLAMLKRL